MKICHCIIKWILKNGNFICTYIEVKKKKNCCQYNTLSSESTSATNVYGSKTPLFILTLTHRKSTKHFDITCDSRSVSCL